MTGPPRRHRRGALLVICLAIAACGRQSSPGERLYRDNCAKCHGLDGAGNTPLAIGYPAANLLAERLLRGSDPVGMETSIRAGVTGRMPAFDWLSDHEMDLLLHYLRYLRGETLTPEPETR